MLKSSKLKQGVSMAQKAIREYDAKSILAKHWDKYFPDFTYAYETVMVQNGSELLEAAKDKKWLNEKEINTVFLKPKYGDASGVRGAAWIGRKLLY